MILNNSSSVILPISLISSTTFPLLMTIIRLQFWRTSGISSEIIIIPRPDFARSLIILCILLLEAISTPIVGPSRINIFGSVASHFASTTRCWFPPERLCAGASIDEVFIARSPTHFFTDFSLLILLISFMLFKSFFKSRQSLRHKTEY